MPVDFKKKYLNLGCGTRYNEDWVNVDFISTDKNVRAYNLNRGIPYPDNTFDVVYHSHILEHFTKNDAEKFIAECHRVLKPRGVIRIAVPDLEQIARNYITFLEKAIAGDELSIANYDWTMLELYDQTVRNYGGGEMIKYYRQEKMINKDFVKERMGYFFEIMTEKKIKQSEHKLKTYIKKVIPLYTIRTELMNLKNKLIGPDYRRLGKFRLSGEVHQWMYDRLSLSRLLKNIGFEDVAQQTALDSYIPNWSGFNLDSEPDGSTYKPDSLFMEAKKLI